MRNIVESSLMARFSRPHCLPIHYQLKAPYNGYLPKNQRSSTYNNLLPVGIFCQIDLSSQSSSFCATCQIDCVSKQTVAWLRLTNNTSHNLTRMNTDRNLKEDKKLNPLIPKSHATKQYNNNFILLTEGSCHISSPASFVLEHSLLVQCQSCQEPDLRY